MRSARITPMPQSTELTTAIVQTVAELEEVQPWDLPPLEENVDPEVVHQLTNARSQFPDKLEFSYLWYQIKVEAGEIVAISP